ncbi:hypothetical protein [Methanopyrus sp.]
MAFRQYLYPEFLRRAYRPAPWGHCRRTDRWSFGRRLLDPVHPDQVTLQPVEVRLTEPDARHPCLPRRLRCATLLSVPWSEDHREEARVRASTRIPWPRDARPPRVIHVPPGGIARHRRFNVSMPYPPSSDRVSRKALFALSLTLELLREGRGNLGGGPAQGPG